MTVVKNLEFRDIICKGSELIGSDQNSRLDFCFCTCGQPEATIKLSITGLSNAIYQNLMALIAQT